MTEEILYNKDNVNDEWNGEVAGQTHSGRVVEKINRSNLEHVTVAGCKHSRISRCASEDFMNCDEVTCQDCPVGWYEARA